MSEAAAEAAIVLIALALAFVAGLTDFQGEFNTHAKIIEFIRSGSVLGKAPIVSMPHWGGIILDPQLEALAAYIDTLKP